LYDRTYNKIFAFVLRRSSEDAASDVVAETYLTVWRRLRDVPQDPRLADAWVFRTAYRVLANTYRGNRRRTALVDRAFRQRRVDDRTNASGAREDETPLDRALERLRPKDREILLFKYWDELDTEQIARIMGCSKNAAAIRLTRAQHALRDAFEASSAGPDDNGDEGGER
jgi:RNA polymerase sigma-70 factor (ECF subfamily)